jgi:hypothetical protein
MPHLSEVLFGLGALALFGVVVILIGQLSGRSASSLRETDGTVGPSRPRRKHGH